MKIVILDGKTTNPGDISWAPLEALGEVTAYDYTAPEDIVSRAAGCEAIIMNRAPITRAVMEALPKLRFVGALATGYNTIDTAAAHELGITVCNVPLYCDKTVAQLAFALLLELTNHVSALSETVRTGGGWNDAIRMSWTTHDIFELTGKTLGILGFGHIGQTVASLGVDLGMRVLVHSRTKRPMPAGCEWVDFDTLFAESDVVSLHCPLNGETRGIVNERVLRLMKPTAFLLNTARGAVVDEAALASALNEGVIAGAGVDVLTDEPPKSNCPLLTAKNCVITPHIAWASRDARVRLVKIVAENLAAFLAGKPQNTV